MTESGRRPFLRMGAAAMAAAGLASRTKTAAAACPEPTGVYGADKVADTDSAALSASIRQQLTTAGLSQPIMNLFPARPGVLGQFMEAMDSISTWLNRSLGDDMPYPVPEGRMMSPRGLRTKYEIDGLRGGNDGLSFVGRFLQDTSKGHVLSGACQCGLAHSRMAEDFPGFRVFVALHETSHFVSAQKYLDQRTLGAVLEAAPDGAKLVDNPGMRTNIRERIADVSAGLYLLSNYKDGPRYLQDVMELRNGMLEPGHYTASSIALAIAAFGKAPRKNLSIVDSTQWAARIVACQNGIVPEYLNAVAVYDAAQAGTTASLNPAEKALVQTAKVNRRALFSPIRR